MEADAVQSCSLTGYSRLTCRTVKQYGDICKQFNRKDSIAILLSEIWFTMFLLTNALQIRRMIGIIERRRQGAHIRA
jgi:hypothetical protein